MVELPHERSYWAVPGRVLGGCYPGDLDPAKAEKKLLGLLRAGVRTVLSLMESGEKSHGGKDFVPYQPGLQGLAAEVGESVSCLRFPIRDVSVPSVAFMRSILDTIDDRLATTGMPVYIHCWGGRGRTGIVIGCYLVRHGLAQPDQVIEELQRLTAHSPAGLQPTPQTSEQRSFVVAWKRGQ